MQRRVQEPLCRLVLNDAEKMKQLLAEVKANYLVAEHTYVMEIHTPEIAPHVRPGQFLHLRCTDQYDPLLRRPLSVLRTRRSNSATTLAPDELDILYEVVGQGTDLLSRIAPGEMVDMLGPIGRAFEVRPRSQRLLMVGGGVGVVPLVALSEEAVEKNRDVTIVAGYRNAERVYPSNLLPAQVDYIVSTDDGSAGRSGFVTDNLNDFLDWPDQVFACGPVPMLKAMKRVEFTADLEIQIAMEERMGCAMGVCLGCVIGTRGGPQRVCRDGPVFDIKEMLW